MEIIESSIEPTIELMLHGQYVLLVVCKAPPKGPLNRGKCQLGVLNFTTFTVPLRSLCKVLGCSRVEKSGPARKRTLSIDTGGEVRFKAAGRARSGPNDRYVLECTRATFWHSCLQLIYAIFSLTIISPELHTRNVWKSSKE